MVKHSNVMISYLHIVGKAALKHKTKKFNPFNICCYKFNFDFYAIYFYFDDIWHVIIQNYINIFVNSLI